MWDSRTKQVGKLISGNENKRKELLLKADHLVCWKLLSFTPANVL